MARPATFTEGFHDAGLTMPYRPLGEGSQQLVSVLSFGASSLGGVFHTTDDRESVGVVGAALKAGINLVDTAPWYGHGRSEAVLGRYFRSAEAPPRSAYYINTKCGRYEPELLEMFDFRAERVTRSVEESLARMGVGYLDSIQVHDPEFAPDPRVIIEQTLPALQKLKDAGKVKQIGMTGYPLSTQRQILQNCSVKVDTSLTYCHYSLNDTTLLSSEYWQLCKSKNIGVINASALSMGLLTQRGPPSWHPAGSEVRAACAAAAAHCDAQGCSLEKLAMVFTLREPSIPTTLVSTSNAGRLQQNVDWCTAQLSDAEEACLAHVRGSCFPRSSEESWACWEGNEVGQYWEGVGRELMVQRLYGVNPFFKAGKLSTE